MIDTLALRRNIINQATSGQLSRCLEGDSGVERIIEKLPAPSVKRKKMMEQNIVMDEVYEIPSHWTWKKLGEISTYGDTPQKVRPSEIADETWILELEDIENGGRLIEKKFGSERKPKGEKNQFSKGQVLYSKLRPYLKKVLVAESDGISTPELVSFDVFAGINPVYITYCLTNTYVDRAIEKRSYGIKMPRIDAAFMVNLPIPIPPEEEQIRIVETVTRALSEIKIIEESQASFSIDAQKLKRKLIDCGISGRLTKQLSEDGNARDYLRIVDRERSEIEESGVLKGRKKKIIKPIQETDIPFSIPDTWEWIRLGHVSEVFGRIGFRGYTKSDIVEKGEGAISLSPSNITFGGDMCFDDCTYISWEKYNESPEIMIESGDILVVKTGSSYGKCSMVEELDYPATINPQLAVLKYVLCDKKYLKLVLNSSLAQKQYDVFVVGAATPTFSQEKLSNFLMPLPPLAEQKRIAQRIDELLAALPE